MLDLIVSVPDHCLYFYFISDDVIAALSTMISIFRGISMTV